METGGGTEFRVVHCACQVRRMREEGETHFCDCDRASATYARPVFFREIGERTSARWIAALAALFARSLSNGARVSGRSAGDGATGQSEGEGAQSGLELVEAALELVLGRVSFGLEERSEKAGGEGF